MEEKQYLEQAEKLADYYGATLPVGLADTKAYLIALMILGKAYHG